MTRARWLSLIGLGVFGCTSFTAVDWSLIPPPEESAGTGPSGGTNASAGEPGEGGAPAGGQAAQGGQGGEGGALAGAAGEDQGGYGGELGGAPDTGGTGGGGGTNGGSAGSGGSSGGGMGGVNGGGSGGTAGGGAGGTGGGATTLCSTYPTGPVATNFAGKIVLFDGGTKPATAAWGGRTGIDAACKTAAQALGLTKKTVHALVAAQINEGITPGVVLANNYVDAFQVPTMQPIVSKYGTPLGQWSDFTTTLNKSMICSGVVTADVESWFSGVNANGDVDVVDYNCNGWTFGDASVDTRAYVGRTDTTARVFHENWLSDHWVTCDSPSPHLLCLAWGD